MTNMDRVDEILDSLADNFGPDLGPELAEIGLAVGELRGFARGNPGRITAILQFAAMLLACNPGLDADVSRYIELLRGEPRKDQKAQKEQKEATLWKKI